MDYFLELKTLKLRIMGACLLFVCYLLFGATVFRFLDGERISFIDSFYFIAMTVLTIGYGDIVPTSDASKLFIVFYAVVGISLGSYILFCLGRYFVRSSIGKLRRTEEEEQIMQ